HKSKVIKVFVRAGKFGFQLRKGRQLFIRGTRTLRPGHSSLPHNWSASGTVVNAPRPTSVQPIARLCSPLSFSESNSAMPAPSIARVPAMKPDLRNGDFMLFHRLFHSF